MWEYNCTPDADELAHYGILGQKWGVRRFQRKDGSLTPAGKKRLKKAKQVKQDPDDNANEDYMKARSKSTKEMSDAELSAAIKRLQMEKQYQSLNPAQVSKGKQVTSYVLKKAGNMALDAGLQLVKDAAVKKAKDKLGLSDSKSDFDKEFDAITKRNKMDSAKALYKKNTGEDWTWSSKKK